MVARIIEINAWKPRPSSVSPAPPKPERWVPPVPTDVPAAGAPATQRSAHFGRPAAAPGPRRAPPIAETPQPDTPLDRALHDVCKALPTASLEVDQRPTPEALTPHTEPGIPAVCEPIANSEPWLESQAPETEAARDTDPGGLLRADEGSPPSEMAKRDRPMLLRLDGANAGQVFSLDGDSVQAGRHPTANLNIQDRGVSRIHARIYRQHGVHWIEDLGSRNGTFVQGRRVDHCILEDGDWVQLGPRASFRFTMVDQKHERILRRLYDTSTRDPLTGAYNRKHFDERLAAEVAYASRHGTTVSLVIFDIDHFKRVNDDHGHQAGDAVLRRLAGAVMVRLRKEDVFARYGGEEFAVILRGIDIRGAARVGERIRAAAGATATNFEGKNLSVWVSVGCASLECAEERTPDTLIATADRRLYVAKRAGRNRVVATDEDTSGR